MAALAECLPGVVSARRRRRADVFDLDGPLHGQCQRGGHDASRLPDRDGRHQRKDGVQACGGQRVHTRRRSRAAGDGFRGPGKEWTPDRAWREDDRPWHRVARRQLDDVGPWRVYSRRHAAWPIADRLGDRRGTQLCARRGHLPDGQFGTRRARPVTALDSGDNSMTTTTDNALRTLKLQWKPVAVSFAQTPPACLPRIDHRLPAGCAYWKYASEGHAFYTTPEDHFNCPVGAFTHGVTLPEARKTELEDLIGTMIKLEYLQ